MTDQEPVYTVLNPRGVVPERKIKPLIPRLDALKGKTVYCLYMTAGNPHDMEFLSADLQKAVPDCNVVYHQKRTGTWQTPFEEDEWEEIVNNADAVVLGVNF